MNLREQVLELVEAGRQEDLDSLVAEEPRALRYLVGLTYQADEEIRKVACRGVGLAGHHHPERVEQILKRLVWAMNDESGTNALTAPDVIKAVADEVPKLLIPLTGDLTRLAADKGLNERLSAALEIVKQEFPGSVSRHLGKSLNKKLRQKPKRGRSGF